MRDGCAEREEVALADAARVLADEPAPIAETTEHVLTVDADTSAWAIADEERVLQIGRALIANALDAHRAGPRSSRWRHRGRAVLAVNDDGSGIPPEHAERVFDRFYRVEGPQASGSGLGLAIARELAEHMDGTVELTSVPGRTTFTLSLPAAPVPSSRRFHVKTDQRRIST